LAGAAALAPTMVTDIVGVARTFPIRVAGNSGPLPFETSFEAIGQDPEHTTVTQKVRRIGRFDPLAFRDAIRVNRPTSLAITFADYLTQEAEQPFISLAERLSGVQVDYLGRQQLSDAWLRPGSLFEQAWTQWQAMGGIGPAAD